MPDAAPSLSSMTGFARADGSGHGHRWSWEFRSVNGRGLDLRLRLPPGFDQLEPKLRERIGAVLSRGSVQVSLTLQRETDSVSVKVNEPLLRELIIAMRRLGPELDAAPPRLDGLFALRGVIETGESELDDDLRDSLSADLLVTFDGAVAALAAARRQEGAAVAEIILARLAEIAELTKAAEDSPARKVEAIRARLAEQVATLMEAAPSLDPDRLHQEAVLLATKADIREELDRLTAHVAAARELVAGGGPVGRKLDFLAQEFNREANTLCAKANDRAITAIGLDLKASVDQLREQVQNLE